MTTTTITVGSVSAARGSQRWVSCQVIGGMLLVQTIASGMLLLSKVILNGGTFVFALLTYRHVVAALCVAPFAFFLERSPEIKSKLRCWPVWFWLFINAITGLTLALSLYYYGLRDTTATYAVNFLNLIPIVTFALSIILRIETLGLNTSAGKIKTIGAILCVAGALTACLYKGKTFHLFPHNHRLSDAISAANHAGYNNESVANDHHNPGSGSSSWVGGTLMLTGSCVSYATWYIVQVKVRELFPYKCWATMLTCFLSAVQSLAVGACVDRSPRAWELGWNLQLVTILYSGAMASAATFWLISWAVAKRGPTFPPMFNPLTLVFVPILSALLLGEQLSVGALLGMVIILVGLYSFLLGKAKEMKLKRQLEGSDDERPNSAGGDPEAGLGGAVAMTSRPGNC
ncbi:unnamed protein product [Linum tenue]|uniref:WAT1-related protein n=1 Tax=Linum tenue TaxID=586396 RepID=A0AAV0GSX0_9ROSI|nr:unnamed protein product [Linum tenue]